MTYYTHRPIHILIYIPICLSILSATLLIVVIYSHLREREVLRFGGFLRAMFGVLELSVRLLEVVVAFKEGEFCG